MIDALLLLLLSDGELQGDTRVAHTTPDAG